MFLFSALYFFERLTGSPVTGVFDTRCPCCGTPIDIFSVDADDLTAGRTVVPLRLVVLEGRYLDSTEQVSSVFDITTFEHHQLVMKA